MNKRTFTLSISACLACVAIAGAQPAAIEPNENARPQRNDLFSSERPAGAQTEITAQKEARFNNEENRATFVGQVVVRDPQFTLFCENLTVFLNENRSGLRLVEAVGDVVIVQENKDERGQVTKSTGRAGKAIFDPASGDITLTQSPQIQQGINNHVAIDPNTIMILNRAGRLSTQGSSRTVIVDANEGALAR